VRVAFRLARATRATAIVKDAKGKAIKALFKNRRFAAGALVTLWDMKSHGKRVKPGIYTVIVSARSPLGRPALTARVRVAKLKKPTPPAAPGA
jgi:hypothetical protein